MPRLLIGFSDNVDIDQATIGGQMAIIIDGLLINSDDDLRDLAEAVLNSSVARQSVGLPVIGGGAIYLNTVQLTDVTRSIEVTP